MDSAAWLTAVGFAVQVAAGVAPMRWPQHAWIAGVIFWLSLAFALSCSGWWILSNQETTMAIIRSGYSVAVLLVALAGLVAWMQWRAADITPVSSPNVTVPPNKDGPRPVFDASTFGKIDAENMRATGPLPPGLAKADQGGQINFKGSTLNVVHDGSVNIAFPPPDGTYSALSVSELSTRLAATAKELRERTIQSDWIASALKGRSLTSQALTKIKGMKIDGPGAQMIFMIYIPDRAAANEAAKFLDTLSVEVARK
jgi:hypothetical protein